MKRAGGALRSGDFDTVGALLDASHASLRDDYEVSCPELDELTDTIRSCQGVYGSRLTGAGFGGCAVSLVDRNRADAIVAFLKNAYYNPRQIEPIVFLTGAHGGVREADSRDDS